MTKATLDKAPKAKNKKTVRSEENDKKVKEYIAQDILSRSTLIDALTAIPINTILQILQNQSNARAEDAVKKINDEEFESILQLINKDSTEKRESGK